MTRPSITCLIALLLTLWCNHIHAQGPGLLISANPTTCNGSEGSITFNGLTPSASYQVTYDDDGVTIGPVIIVSNASGQLSITGLNAGMYTPFTFNLNGSIEEVFTGVILSNPIFRPAFTPVPPFCAGDPAPVLPTISNNGISGTWDTPAVSNLASRMYTFTPAPGTCALPVNISVTVIPRTVPVFSFGRSLVICGSGTVPVLPNTSLNGINGTWSPAVVDPNNSGTYIFTPTTTGCITGTSFTVTVNPNITPMFSFGTSGTICSGMPVPTLPNTSLNGITGTWSPAVVSNATSGTYTFTPTPGQCALTTTYTQTVDPIITPVFSFGTTLTICSGDAVPVLPATSLNGITGTWNPAVVSNTTSGTYTFTPTSDPCAPPVTFTVTVNPIITPTFSFGNSQSVCINATAPVLPNTSLNGINGTWSPAVVDNQITGTYTFTPAAGQCATTTTFTFEVNPIPTIVNIIKDTTVYDGAVLPPYSFTGSNPGVGVNWVNSNTSIGLPASGKDEVPSFKAVNMTNDPVVAVITATPFMNGCVGIAQTYRITVLPLDKDIFVPNVFSPNGDGSNDQLFVYGNYIATMELHIFNQWGERITVLNSKTQGWDGKYKGSPQPVGVYVYVLKAVLINGTQVNKKGSITLLR
jgi:gliding motility-associated-like protein